VVAAVLGVVDDGCVENGDVLRLRGGDHDVVKPAGCTVRVDVRESPEFRVTPSEGVNRTSRQKTDGEGFVPQDIVPTFSVQGKG
jgi:hypothetical protein